MNLWLVLIVAGLLTYATRLSFILLVGRHEIPPLLTRVLRFVPPAVLSAIIFPEVLMPGNELLLGNPRLLAGLAAVMVAWRTRSVILTILVGMLVLWILQILNP